MSAPIKTKEEIVRLAWLVELRRQGDRQCTGDYTDGQGNVCALGLLAQIGFPGIGPGNIERMDRRLISNLASLTEEQATEIVARNDGTAPHDYTVPYHKHTFAEIADVVEGWFR